MANTTAKTQFEGTSIQADIAEGKALGDLWKKKQASLRRSFTADTAADGFDTRLGKLMQKLKAASEAGRVSRQVLTAHGIYAIDKRRRAEALWFVENQPAATDFIKASKKGFTSLTALQAAMRKAAKDAAKPDNSEADKSKVGPTETETPAKAERPKISHTVMVNTILRQAEVNGLDLEKIIEDLMSAIPAKQVAA